MANKLISTMKMPDGTAYDIDAIYLGGYEADEFAKVEDLENKADVYKITNGATNLSEIKVGMNLSGVTLKFEDLTYDAPTANCYIFFGNNPDGEHIRFNTTPQGYDGTEFSSWVFGLYYYEAGLGGDYYRKMFATGNWSGIWNEPTYTFPTVSDDRYVVTSIAGDLSANSKFVETTLSPAIAGENIIVDCEYNYNELQKKANATDIESKANVYKVEGSIVFNGCSVSQFSMGPMSGDFYLLGTIDNGNTGIVATGNDDYVTHIYYSADLANRELTTFLCKAGQSVSGVSIQGSNIEWISTSDIEWMTAFTPLGDFLNAFTTSESIFADCEYNYKNKADIYKATVSGGRSAIQVGDDLSGKTIYFDTSKGYNLCNSYIQTTKGYLFSTSMSPPECSVLGINGWETVYRYDVGLLKDSITLPSDAGTVTNLYLESSNELVTLATDIEVTVDCEYNYNEIQTVKTEVNGLKEQVNELSNSSGGGAMYMHQIQIYYTNGSAYLTLFLSSNTPITTASALYNVIGSTYTAVAISHMYGSCGGYIQCSTSSVSAYGYARSGAISESSPNNITDTVKQV